MSTNQDKLDVTIELVEAIAAAKAAVGTYKGALRTMLDHQLDDAPRTVEYCAKCELAAIDAMSQLAQAAYNWEIAHPDE
jgi:hypothetical protein